nr:SGNH hydrolase domain-containing protein [Rhodocyclus purpureus]
MPAGERYPGFREKCPQVNEKGGILVWGDSHAAALANGILQLRTDLVQFTANSCPPVAELDVAWRAGCREIGEHVLGEIRRLQPRDVVLHAYWTLYEDPALLDKLKRTVEHIRSAVPASRITIVGSVPRWKPSLPEYLVRERIRLDAELYIRNSASDELLGLDDSLKTLSEQSLVRFFSPFAALCVGRSCRAGVEHHGVIMPTAWDYGHLTEGGAWLVAKALSE